MYSLLPASLYLIIPICLIFFLASPSTILHSNSSSTSLTQTGSGLVDLHTHTTLSDGTDTTRELIEKAYNKGIRTLAITDHDQLRYDDDAIAYGVSLGMTIIRGTELSCEWTFHTAYPRGEGRPLRQSKAHLLGHFTHGPSVSTTPPTTPPSPISTPSTEANQSDALADLLASLGPRRAQRNIDILKRLKEKFNIDLTIEQVQATSRLATASKTESAPSSSSSSDFFGRPHIARALISLGLVTSVSEAFAKYLNDDVLELPEWSLDIAAAAHAIVAHGGVPTLAHPMTLGLTYDELETELKVLLSIGTPIRGIEVYSSKATSTDSAALLLIANRLGLVPTGGSDYHGRNKETVPLGEVGKDNSAADSTKKWNGIARRNINRLNKLRQGGVAGDVELLDEEVNGIESDSVGDGTTDLSPSVGFLSLDPSSLHWSLLLQWSFCLLLLCTFAFLVRLLRQPVPPSHDHSYQAQCVRSLQVNPIAKRFGLHSRSSSSETSPSNANGQGTYSNARWYDRA